MVFSWQLVLTEWHEHENMSLYGLSSYSGISLIKQSCVPLRCSPAKQQFGLWEMAVSVQTNLYFLFKFKCQFSLAVDSDDFNQLKEAKQADVDDKPC